jgi:hypothetical protein
MFGDMIEKAQKLASNVMRISNARARSRARFQVAGSILAGILANPELHLEREEAMEQATECAQQLEARVYTDEESEDDFDFES